MSEPLDKFGGFPGKFESPTAAGGKSPSPEDDAKQRLEDEAAARFGSRETMFEELAKNGEKASEIFFGMRKILEPQEDSNVPEETRDRWEPMRVFNALYARKQALSIPIDDLIKSGWITDYDEKTGMAKITDRKYAQMAISIKETPEWVVAEKETIKVGEQVQEVERKMLRSKFEYNFGTRAKRKEMARACERAYLEFGGRAVIGTILGTIDAYRDDLAGLTTTLHLRASKLKVPQIEALLNLPGINEVDANVEDFSDGVKIEKAIWWYLAMMASETKQGMKDFLDLPATKELVMPGASDEERTRFLKTMLGNYDEWTDDNLRTKETLSAEVRAGKRGPISMYGNIPARGRGENRDFGFEKEVTFVETIGSLAGDIGASWIGSAILKSAGEFAINGKVRFERVLNKEGKVVEGKEVKLELGTDIWLSGDDRGKFDISEYQLKEMATGRLFGPKDLVEKLPQMGISYLDHAQIVIGYNPDGTPITRSIRDAWLGSKGGPILDRVTGETKVLPEEPYRRLGSLDFKSLPRGDWSGFTLLQWLAGREDRGIYDMATNLEPDPKEYGPTGLRRMRKYFTIVYNALIATIGKFRGQSNPNEIGKRVAKKAMEDVVRARENSQSFYLNVASRDLEVYDPTGSGDLNNRNLVSAKGLFEETAKKLGMIEGSEFKAEDQFFDDDKKIRAIPKTKAKLFG